MEEVVILGAKRTPIGAFQGELSSFQSPELGACAMQAALEVSGASSKDVEEVLMGCVLTAGLGQAPARQAALGAGLPSSASCTTLNKVCGSGMKTVMIAYDAIRIHDINLAIAGGMESMSNAPYLLKKARSGYRMGNGELFDHMILDGLENAYDHCHMGLFAEKTAEKYKFTRQDQDEFSISSSLKALKAIDDGSFEREITPLHKELRKESSTITQDECPLRVKIEKVSTLKPAFKEGGTVTAANSSSISDGAAALVLSSRSYADHHHLKPHASVCGHASHSQEPEWFTTAPTQAIRKLLDKIGWSLKDVDLFEINEAFSVVTMATIADLQIPPEKVNIHGGACALGHPIGASGARIMVTLLYALESQGLKRGVATLCIGGGEATAIALERE